MKAIFALEMLFKMTFCFVKALEQKISSEHRNGGNADCELPVNDLKGSRMVAQLKLSYLVVLLAEVTVNDTPTSIGGMTLRVLFS